MKLWDKDKAATAMSKAVEKNFKGALKKLDKRGVDIEKIVFAVEAQDTTGRNMNGVLFFEEDGTVGFAGKGLGEERAYHWGPDEGVRLRLSTGRLFGWIVVETTGGHSLKLSKIESNGAKRFYEEWEAQR